MLSRAPISQTVDDNMEKEIPMHVHLLSHNLPVTESKLEENKTSNEEPLRTIKSEWPETKV